MLASQTADNVEIPQADRRENVNWARCRVLKELKVKGKYRSITTISMTNMEEV